jgi:hypothetical protein
MQVFNEEHAILIIEVVSKIILLGCITTFNIRILIIQEVSRGLNDLSRLYRLIKHPRRQLRARGILNDLDLDCLLAVLNSVLEQLVCTRLTLSFLSDARHEALHFIVGHLHQGLGFPFLVRDQVFRGLTGKGLLNVDHVNFGEHTV